MCPVKKPGGLQAEEKLLNLYRQKKFNKSLTGLKRRVVKNGYSGAQFAKSLPLSER